MVIEKRSGDICDGCMDEFWLVQPGEHECLEKDCGCNLTDLHRRNNNGK
jgi:hypothetical protein